MERPEVTTYINNQTPDVFLEKAKKRGYICPACGNGSGKDGDGIVKNPKTGKYKCFRCGFSGDILDLIGLKYNLQSFSDQVRKAAEIYGINLDTYQSGQKHIFTAQQKQQASKTISDVAVITRKSDVSSYIAKCHAAAGQTDYFTKRGITQDSIDRFRLGYDPDFREGTGRYKWQAVIIPTSEETYEARNTAVLPNSAENSGNKYRKHGSVRLFNIDVLQTEKEKPIFVCEGVFDAISLIQCGGQAIGLGSAVNYKHLVAVLDKVIPAKPLILAFDNDVAGKDNADKLAVELKHQSIPFIIATDLIGDFHDVNDRLLRDAEGLKAAILKAYEAAEELPDPVEEAKNEYIKTSAGESLQAFIDAIKAAAGRPRLSTGFRTIDDALDGGLYTGLYFIGAISSLGKTTLALQIVDNLAKQGRDVLVYTLEQSKFDLMSKSISRESYLYCKQNGIDDRAAKSNLGIMDGRRWLGYNQVEQKVVREAFSAYGAYAKHVFIFEGVGNISVSEIRDRLKSHIALTGNKRPIICIDYLQILKAPDGDERATDKQIVDHNVTALKQLSRDFDIPIIAISSLNRQNYSGKINMSAFKESGAIEYGSDVLIGLQFTGAGGENFNIDSAKEQDPRHIDFCILKNRNGKTTADGLQMTFYPRFNCFVDEDDIYDDVFRPVSKEDEDSCPFG